MRDGLSYTDRRYGRGGYKAVKSPPTMERQLLAIALPYFLSGNPDVAFFGLASYLPSRSL
jgi:hypothetical protein